MQQLVVYLHKNNFLWDIYFALGMNLAIESDPDGVLFPQFFKKLTKSNWNGKGDSNDSKSTELWNKYHKELLELSKMYQGK